VGRHDLACPFYLIRYSLRGRARTAAEGRRRPGAETNYEAASVAALSYWAVGQEHEDRAHVSWGVGVMSGQWE